MAKKMTEKLSLPPKWCSAICTNAMNEVCIEHCIIKRDCSGFKVKQGLKLANMPRFPDTVGMTREERFTSVTVYLAKVVEELQGEQNDYIYPPVRRPITHNPTGSGVPSAIQIQGVLSGISQAITPLEIGEEHPSEDVRSAEVAQPAD